MPTRSVCVGTAVTQMGATPSQSPLAVDHPSPWGETASFGSWCFLRVGAAHSSVRSMERCRMLEHGYETPDGSETDLRSPVPRGHTSVR